VLKADPPALWRAETELTAEPFFAEHFSLRSLITVLMLVAMFSREVHAIFGGDV
jgi:hypothetical protein